MPILYFDNFRGFQSTFLSLKEVNFFIGENSTGKTSVLKLLTILSSPGFWYYQKFNNTEISLGSFSEIISSDTNKEFFQLGIFSEEINDNNIAIKLKFIDENNLPSLKEIRFRNDTIDLQASIDGRFLKYRYAIIADEKFKGLTVEQYFKSWIDNNELDNDLFYREEIQFTGIESILSTLQTIITRRIENEKSTKLSSSLVKITKPQFLNPIAYTAPVRAEPRKTYDDFTLSFSSRGEHIPYVLSEILVTGGPVEDILKKFGYDSGLFEDVKINLLNSSSDKGMSIEILIGIGGRFVNIANVGFGVSQILPILIEIIARPKETYFAIQQTEVHLHPRAQAALGDFLFKSNNRDHQKFIIETHSDYTIDRFRLRVNREYRENSSATIGDISQVVFFKRVGVNNTLDVIEIRSDGSYSEEQPKEFREFFIKEQLDLLTI
ncbi:AAA family ATPase [Chitinophaga defluvii]|uniref:AAA family ATPase n=1 Tax=Chitinophaga defluvii TaxID=3163343 RepID=A0ABV2T053_9BACT